MYKKTLRFITCGSVDDGKSTLIGRLLFESKNILEDQLKTLKKDSKQYGTQGDKLDFALLVDGLQAEREQGITIDVAYRFFSTSARKYIVADTPGHEQYTRNMATGASTADIAIILIDARKGILTQTKRHSRIVSMMGIKNVILAINKMDLINFNEQTFNQTVAGYMEFSKELEFDSIDAIPISGLDGDNIVTKSNRTNWYAGISLMDYLDNIELNEDLTNEPFRMPVQYVNRPNLDFRGYCGKIAHGIVNIGDHIQVAPSGRNSKIKAIIKGFQETPRAVAGDSVTLVIDDEIDITRGDVITHANMPCENADQFEANLIWLSERQLMPGRQYIIKLHCKEATATITDIKFRYDINSGAKLATKTLALNEIAHINLSTSVNLVFEPYKKNKTLGGFILIDKLTFETVAAGMINFALRRASNIHWQAVEINKISRAKLKLQKPKCLWLTGLSGSGKSTIANMLEKRLYMEGKHTYLLDGDNIRHGLNRDLGFTDSDRVENIRRVAEVAKLMVDAGLIVLVSFISPFKNERDMARAMFDEYEFIEIFIDVPLAVCEARDVKGLYAKAKKGELKNFTGIDSIYEAPKQADIRLQTDSQNPEDCVEIILRYLLER